MTALSGLIRKAMRATAEKEKAFAECEYDRDHFCWREINAEHEAHKALEEGIRQIIREEVEAMKKEGGL